MRPVVLLLSGVLAAFGQTNPSAEGDIVDSITGAPVAGARLKLALPSGDFLYYSADPRGHFRIPNSPSSAGPLLVQGRGYLEAMHAAPTPGATLRIPLTPYAAIAGKVIDPDGLPLLRAVIDVCAVRPFRTGDTGAPGVRVLPDGQNSLVRVSQAASDDRGEFRIAPLKPGTYYLVAGQFSVGDARNQVTYYPHALEFANARPVELSAGQQLRADMQIAVQAGRHVAGRILPPAGRTFPHSAYTNVFLMRPDSEIAADPSRMAINLTDRYELKDVAPGIYTLLAATSVPGETPWGLWRPIFGIRTQFAIGDRDLDTFDIQMQELPGIPGTIGFVAGCSPGPVQVHVSGDGAGTAVWSDANVTADGRFALGNLGPAHLKLTVTAPGYRVVSARLGDLDVLRDGFDYPFPPDASLRIVVDCIGGGRQ